MSVNATPSKESEELATRFCALLIGPVILNEAPSALPFHIDCSAPAPMPYCRSQWVVHQLAKRKALLAESSPRPRATAAAMWRRSRNQNSVCSLWPDFPAAGSRMQQVACPLPIVPGPPTPLLSWYARFVLARLCRHIAAIAVSRRKIIPHNGTVPAAWKAAHAAVNRYRSFARETIIWRYNVACIISEHTCKHESLLVVQHG